jgi:hypothetical protein
VNPPTDPAELGRIAQRVLALQQEHRDLDVAIAGLQSAGQHDDLAIKRLKKRKLQLKDCIARLQAALIPDEPA